MSDESHSQMKRMFFGLEVDSPWPKKLPKGRILDEAHRHLTLAFLGNVPYGLLQLLLPSLPIPSFGIGPVGQFDQILFLPPRRPNVIAPSFGIGPVGQFDQILFLPPRRPNVIAWRVDWFRGGPLLAYQRALVEYLRQQGYRLDEREFLSHVTLARWPFDRHAWERLPFALPVVGRAIHLYESVGSMRYMPIWTLPLMPPFEVLSHTADIAFFIRGDSLKRLFLHAQVALAFEFPPFLRYVYRPIGARYPR